MHRFENEFEKLNIRKQDHPKYSNPEQFAKRFQRCSIYEYGNTGYSNSTKSEAIATDKRRDA